MSNALRLVSLLLPIAATVCACAGTVVDASAVGAGGGGSSSTTSFPVTTTASTGGSTTATSSSSSGSTTATTSSSSGSTTATTSSSGGGGACTGANDEAIVASGVVFPALVACGTQYIGSEPAELTCIETKTHLSQPCAVCEDDYVRCILVNCLNQCISVQSSPECVSCRAQHCDAAFAACSGLPDPPG